LRYRYNRKRKYGYKTEFQLRQELHQTPYPLLCRIQRGHECWMMSCRLTLTKARSKYMRHRCIHVLVRSCPGSRIWNKVYQTSDHEDAVDKITQILGV
jgi:hypothetical protein